MVCVYACVVCECLVCERACCVVCVCCGVCWPQMLLPFKRQPPVSGTGQPEAPLCPGEGGGSAGTGTWVGTGT